jgi:methylenetetrahydrofolate--tRNA-(uracil-5-)-methyltransferase
MGLVAGLNCFQLLRDRKPLTPPADTALGALLRHLTETSPKHFQPSNVNFGLFPAWEKKVPKRLRGEVRAERSRAARTAWISQLEANV